MTSAPEADTAVPQEWERVKDGAFDRQPPCNVKAEQVVLGAMMLSRDACGDVVEILKKSEDFYRPVHATIFDKIVELYTSGEPTEPIALAQALADSGDLARVGGAPYLHTLLAAVPTAANGGYYARIVADQAVLRRLVEAGTRIVQLGYGSARDMPAGRNVSDIAQLSQQAILEVTEQAVGDDVAVLSDMLQPTLDEIEAIGQRGGVMTGVPTGFTDLDRLLNGLHPGQLVIVAGRPGLGKALALDTLLPTPTGWTTMGEVKAGDQLLGADGRPTTITNAFDVMHDRPCYEVEFSDGSVIVADAEHLWKTTTRASRRQRGEIRPAYQWSEAARTAAAAAHQAVTALPDRLITYGDAVEIVGDQFRTVLHVVAARVGTAGKVTREYTRRGKPWRRSIDAYSAHTLLAALLDRVNRRMNAETTAKHDGAVTTAHIAATLRHPTDGRLNHAVDNARPLALPARDLPVAPYTLGAWLGDGTTAGSSFTTADPEILSFIESDGYVVQPTAGRFHYGIKTPALPPLPDRDCVVCGTRFTPRGPGIWACGQSCGGKSKGLVREVDRGRCFYCGTPFTYASASSRVCHACRVTRGSFTGLLRAAGVLGNKHIPAAYLRASEAQRRALLAGLLDTDGTITGNGNAQFTTTSARLAEDVREVIVSLGYRCSISRKPVKGRTPESSVAYNLNFTTTDEVFRLGRKRDLHRQRRRSNSSVRTGQRYIVDARPVASVPVRCVTVDNDDHLYLAGRSMIPTHNSTASLDFARNTAIRYGNAAAVFSLEMSKVEIIMRLLSAEARVPLHVLRSGNLSDDDWSKLARCMGDIAEAPLFVDDTPSMNLMQLRAKAMRLRKKHDVKLIVVDYLQLMTVPKAESRQQAVSDLSRGLKLLAKEVECPVIAVCQLNRGPEQRTDKRPQLSDLRESGSLEQDADVVILLHRDDYYDKESPRGGEGDFIVAKHRNGPTDTITVAAQLHLSRFVDMAIV